MTFPRYPDYKDSGVEWLGEVPAHWNINRLKHSVTSCKNGIWGDEAKQDESDIACVRVADFDRQKLRVKLNEPTIRNVTEKERVGRLLEHGDLLLEKSGGGELQPVGCVVIYDDLQPAVCSNFIARMKIATGMNSSFWRYVHAAAYAVRLTTGSINQTSGIQNLDQDRYFNERAAFPPLPEQQTIAIFLDRETAKIDALIAEQQRLIELLKEKRRAVISHAVTKGLNPEAPMRASGIEWLGEVPAHWNVGPLKHFAQVMDCKHFTVSFIEEGLPIVSIREVRDDKIDLSNAKLTSQAEWDFLRENRAPQYGDMIFCRNASVGAVGYVDFDEPFCMGQDVCLIRPRTTSRFLHYQLISPIIRNQIEALLVGATIRRANVEEIRNLFVFYPKKEELSAIVTFLDRETIKLDALTVEAQRTIALLQERRIALISAAVTGKIDVRSKVSTAVQSQAEAVA
jgi:type I restriction enzyme S subunit